jgi:hypothetical protein
LRNQNHTHNGSKKAQSSKAKAGSKKAKGFEEETSIVSSLL